MAYLAVDRNGTEIITDLKPTRVGKRYIENNGKTIYREVYQSDGARIDKNDWYRWTDLVEGDLGERIEITVELPKGTIKKLIGRELTWNDEPFKYE